MIKARRSICSLFALAVVFAAGRASATTFYVDPQKGSMSGDGSAQSPWHTIEEVLAANLIETQTWDKFPYAPGAKLVPKNAGAPVKAGDTVLLLDGYHGEFSVSDDYNDSDITIAAAPGASPRLSRIEVAGGSHFHFLGLFTGPSYAPTYDASRAMIALSSPGYQGPAHDITVEGCFLESVPDTSAWTGDQWLTLPADGITASGDHHLIKGNHLHNVRFGISVDATNTLVDGNTIDSFGNGDGMRGLGDDSTFQYNVVKNAHHPDPDPSKGNHDDGFQSWSLGVDPADGKTKPGFGVVKNITLRGNLVISYEDLNQPFPSDLQGLSGFDGMYQGFVVENNVVISSTYHGISFYGCIDCRIVNNTVIDRRSDDKPVPWIMVHDHKNGTVSTGCLVRNNLTTALSIQSADVKEDHDYVVTDPAMLFLSPATFDLHLLPTAAVAIDTGSADMAPAIDRDGIPRPQGKGFDLGAYEWHTPDVGPGGSGGTADAGGSSGTGGSSSQGGGAGTGGPTGAGGASGASGHGGTSSAGAGGTSPTTGAGGSGHAGGSTSVGGSASAGKGGMISSAGTTGSAGTGGGAPAAPADAASPASDGGCGCETKPRRSEPAIAVLAAAALLAARRRRGTSRRS